MRAIYYDGTLGFSGDYPVPERGVGEALVQVLAAGICRTDLEIVKGYMEFEGVLGHEFVGVVAACDEARWLGKRVVEEINCGCGKCLSDARQARIVRGDWSAIVRSGPCWESRDGTVRSRKPLCFRSGIFTLFPMPSRMKRRSSWSRWRPVWRSRSRCPFDRRIGFWCWEMASWGC